MATPAQEELLHIPEVFPRSKGTQYISVECQGSVPKKPLGPIILISALDHLWGVGVLPTIAAPTSLPSSQLAWNRNLIAPPTSPLGVLYTYFFLVFLLLAASILPFVNWCLFLCSVKPLLSSAPPPPSDPMTFGAYSLCCPPPSLSVFLRFPSTAVPHCLRGHR